MKIDTSKMVSIVRNQDFYPFDLFIDHINNNRIDIFLTRINYRIGEVQYIRGVIRFDQKYSYGMFTSNLVRTPIVAWHDKRFTSNKTTAKTIIKALKTCIETIC